MQRRKFILLSVGAAVSWPLAARAQQSSAQRLIGMLMAGSAPGLQERVKALREGLQGLGWVEGRNLHMEEHWAGTSRESVKKELDDLLSSHPELVVTGTTVGAKLLSQQGTIPAVFVGIADPAGSGVVTSLAKPGGNITGFTAFEYGIGGKWLALLKEVAPQVQRVALLFNPDTGLYVENFWHSFEASAQSVGIVPLRMGVRDAADVQTAIESFAREPNGGLLGVPEVAISVHGSLIVALAAKYRLPMIYPYRYYAIDGGLMSYGIDVLDMWRRSASYIDRVLKGEKPAELPVQAPTKFELVINMKAAKALGLTIPSGIIAIADEVIE